MFTDIYNSPIGRICITASEKGLTELKFDELLETPIEPNIITDQARRELEAYFMHGEHSFASPLDLDGTSFQQKIWEALKTIPYGTTLSYQALSLQIGDLKAIRAVAAANGQNPIAIMIPCHRVIGSDGSLTGYAGGLHRKEWLLQHEGAIASQLNIF